MSVNVKFHNPQGTADRICNDEATGLFLATEFARFSDQFVPMDSGALSTNIRIEPFKVTYTVPYAHRIYNGDTFNFSEEKHPNAQAHWDVPTKQIFGDTLAQEVEEYIRSR